MMGNLKYIEGARPGWRNNTQPRIRYERLWTLKRSTSGPRFIVVSRHLTRYLAFIHPRPTQMDSQPSKTSKTSKAKRPTSGKTKTVIVPIIPQDVIDEILGHLAADSDFISLQSCALVSKSWVPACRRHLFHTIHFSSKDRARWLETFPVPEESPARYVRHLHITVKRSDSPLRMTSFGGLPQSVTSLTVVAIIAVLPKIQQIMVQLPNLDDLSLSGQITAMDQNMLFGIGSVLRGRFGGKLQLLGVHASPGVVDMLLEIPTGLRFTEVEIRSSHEYLFSIVRLVEACSKTLVKLSYAISSHRKPHPFS